jgi:beta-lactamase regulating signal transducer with metallopeptidase domain
MIDHLFIQILTVSLSVSLLVLLARVLVPVLRKHYTAKWRYWLWLLLALRLLIPATPVFTSAQQPAALSQAGKEAETQYRIVDPEDPEPVPMPQVSETRESVDFIHILAVIWLAGMIAHAAFQGILYIRFQRRTGRWSQPAPDHLQTWWEATGTEMGVRRLPRLLICPAVDTPMLAGVVRPKLLIPHDAYSSGECAFIFKHELIHYRRGDLWYKLALMLANCAHWFNPIVYLLAGEAGKDIEISCDDAVVHNMDRETRTLYGDSLVRALPRQRRMNAIFTTHFGSAKETMKLRLNALFDGGKKRRGRALFCLMAALLVVLGTSFAQTPVLAANAKGGSTVNVSIDNLSAGQVIEVGKISIKKGDTVLFDVNATAGSGIFVSLSKNTGTTETKNGHWLQYQSDRMGNTVNYTFESTVSGTYYVYVGSVDKALSGISGLVTTSIPQDLPVFRLPHSTHFGVSEPDYRIKLGPYALKASESYTLTATWSEGGSVDVKCAGVDKNGKDNGTLNTYKVTSGTPVTITVPKDGYYYTEIPRGTKHTNFNYSFGVKGQPIPAVQSAPKSGTVIINTVELRHYSAGAPYLYDTVTNNSGRNIEEYQRGMMAFDKDGKPLKMLWNPFGDGAKTHYFLFDWGSDTILSGTTKDSDGGWSMGDDDNKANDTESIAYVLYCFKQLTFDDGTTWKNPNYQKWLDTYKDKTVDVKTLEDYYPYSVSIS